MAMIIIVDDDELIARLASDILVEASHACGWVTGVEQARALLKWRRPDMLLLDHDMPGVTGGEFLRELRGSAYHYDLPVIMFTRMNGIADEEAARYNGAQDYVRKPFRPEDLTYKVQRLLDARAEREKHRALEEELRRSSGAGSESAPYLRRVF